MHKGIEGPLVLVVLDGVGESKSDVGNAVRLAYMPFFNNLKQKSAFTTLRAHGAAVGLPSETDMGNSEVGHNAMGAGQVYDQGAKLVNEAIASGEIFRSPIWHEALARAKEPDRTLHFIGLLSDGNVHSHIRHLLAMLERTAEEGVHKVRVHVLLDGRDVGGTTAHVYVDRLESALAGLNQEGRDYRIASGGGRMKVTMDRYEADWTMVETGWRLHVLGEGRAFSSAMRAIQAFREAQPGIIDQDLPGFVIEDDRGPVGPIQDGDSVIFFNFRGDRAIEISRAFDEDESFQAFDRIRKPDVFFAGMMQYDGDIHCPQHFLVGPPRITNTLSEFLVAQRVPQYAISETQKYGHVTYFWNGNRSGKIDAQTEDYVEIPSDNLSFDQRPWMKAAEITDALIDAIASGRYRFLRVNYANGDMVGHTGNLQASVIAMSWLDIQLQRLLQAVNRAKGVAIVTADHGNCDEMFELDRLGKMVLAADGQPKPKTSHTLSPVPFLIYDPHGQVDAKLRHDPGFGLGNVTATAVEIMGFHAPKLWQPSLLDWKH